MVLGTLVEEDSRMAEIREELGKGFCRWCAYCMPCPQGVTIDWVMNAQTMHSYGDRYYTNTAKAMETAANCVQCAECESKCPYQLPIVDTIAKNVEWYAQQEPYKLRSSGPR